MDDDYQGVIISLAIMSKMTPEQCYERAQTTKFSQEYANMWYSAGDYLKEYINTYSDHN